MLLCINTIHSENIKIQLDEQFDFVGIESFDPLFKNHIQNSQNKINELDTLIFNEEDKVVKKTLLNKRLKIEQKSLDFILKKQIQELLLKYYGKKTIASRLGEESNESIDQKYVYLKANVSKVNKVEFIVGGNLDLGNKKIGSKQIILTVTAGIEIYNLATGELYYTNVFTFGSRIKRNIDDPLSDKKIIEVYTKDLKSLFDYLIKGTYNEYQPSIVEATIVKKHKNNTFIIDKGSSHGFIVGKTVTSKKPKNNFDVIEASPNVSLIQSFSDSNKEFVGKKIKLFGNKAEDPNKPKVLVTEVKFLESYMFDKNLYYDKSTITQWFKDNLSTYCNLFIVPSDPRTISNFQEEVSKYGSASSKTLIKNLIKPDYIINPKIIYAYNVNNEGQESAGIETSISTLEVLLEMQLIDFNTGIILKTKRFTAIRDQEQSDISEVDMTDLFPALVKDGIITMCKQLDNELSVSKIEAKIKKSKKKNMYNIDFIQGNDLKHGEILSVYRKNIKVENLNGKSIGYLEKYIGDVSVVKLKDKIYVTPYLPWTKIKSEDIIRGYSSSSQISENIISIKMKPNDNNILLPKVSTKSKVKVQKPLPKKLVLSNYYYAVSNNKNFTPVLDSKNKKFLKSLKSVMDRGYYVRDEEEVSENVVIKYLTDIQSTVHDKEKVHDTRIDLRYRARIRLFDPNDSKTIMFESTNGLERIIGDEKKSNRDEKKRAKKNIVIKGLRNKEINREFFDINLKMFEQSLEDLAKDIKK